MANTKPKRIKSLVICVLLLGSMIILSSREVAAQSIGGTVYEDANMNGVLDGAEAPLVGADVFLDYPAGMSTVSGGGGAYNFATSMGFHWVTVRMPGYKTVTKNIQVTGAMTLNFGLVPFESITGRAIKTDGTGVVGMHVEVYDQTFTFIQETFTDVFGNYCVHGLAPGVYHLRIMKAEYFDQWKYNIVVDGVTILGTQYNWHTTPNVNFTNLSYDHGMIFGTVFSGAGPLPGAVVEVPGLGLSTTTDAFGNYSIHNIPAGWYYVVAKKSGFQTGVEFICVTNGTTGPTGPVNFTLTTATGLPIIEGSVSDGIHAIENALVEIPGLFWTYGTTLELYTDKAGYYIFADYPGSNTYAPHPLGPGKFTIVMRNEAGITTDESDNHHKTNARIVITQMWRVTRADFKLEENPGIKFGRVINTDGIGVEGAIVSVPYSPYRTVTDSNGVFALELPSETYSEDCDPGTDILPYQTARGFDEMNYCGMTDTFQLGVVTPLPAPQAGNPHRMHKARYLIKVERGTYITTLEYYIPVPGGPGLQPGDPPDPCDICVNGIILNYKTGVLKGQAYDGTGQPVTNGFVFVAGRDVPLQANGFFETHDVPAGTYTAAVIDPTRTILGTETGIHVYYDQVTYEVINLGPTPTTLFISGFIYSNKVRLDASGDTLPDANGYSAGAAFDPGEGIPGVTVETTATYSAVTDSYGFYCITGIPTTVTSTTIVATKSGYITIANPFVAPVSILFFFPGFAGTAGATVSPMSKFRGSLSGRVTNKDGRDISGVIASIWEPAQIMDETDTNGFYIFEDVEYGSYLIMVCGGGTCGIDYKVTFSRGSPFQPVTVDGNVTKDITMEKTKGRVEGIVNDGVNPLQDVAVRVSGKYYSSTDTVGYYTMLNVPSGTHTAYAYGFGYQILKHNNTDQSIGISQGQIFTANFSLTGGLMNTGWIEGYITLELTDGFCDVIARLNPSFDFATTDSEGYYLITGVSTGTQYYVHGEKANYMTVQPAGPLAVNAGVGTWATLVHLKRCTGSIGGYITDSQTTAPIVGATVILSDMNRNDEVSIWYPGTDYYTDYVRSKIYETTTSAAEPYTDSNTNGSYDLGEPYTDSNGNGQWDGAGYYWFTNVPWSDANTSGLNKTWAWTVVVIETGYAVGVSNATVVCGSTSTVSFTIDPLCAIAGSVTFDPLCASSATVTATQIAGGDEGSTEFGWSSNGAATVMNSGDSYYIGHLHPGAYDVTAAAGSCSMISPVTPYTGAYAIPANYRMTTLGVDFGFGISLTSGGSGSSGKGSESDEQGEQEQGEQEQGEQEQGEQEQGGEQSSGSDSSSTSTGQQQSQQDQQGERHDSKLLMELATQAIRQAKTFKKKVYDALEQIDDTPGEVEELLYQADAYLEKALEFFEQKNYAEALVWADKAIQYYQEILQLLT
ncbi:MAG: carboxypeptidase regulatory-like domain-containing protein [Theionarchaea archaeon]|nr:carboxypeptidase regulatory-like domain-containing protein [Theionarchaea archaeon]